MNRVIVLDSIEKAALLGLLTVVTKRGDPFGGWLMASGYPNNPYFDPWTRLADLGLATVYKNNERTVVAFTEFGFEYAKTLKSFEEL
jgi:hypothetical protein